MARTRSAYTPEFRRRMVELVRGGRTPEELAHELEPTRSRSGTGLASRRVMVVAATAA